MAEILASSCLFCAPVLPISNEDNTFCLFYPVDLFKTVAVSIYLQHLQEIYAGLSPDYLHEKMSNKNKTPCWLTSNLKKLKLSQQCTL